MNGTTLVFFFENMGSNRCLFLELADFGLAIEVNGEQTQWYGMYPWKSSFPYILSISSS